MFDLVLSCTIADRYHSQAQSGDRFLVKKNILHQEKCKRDNRKKKQCN